MIFGKTTVDAYTWHKVFIIFPRQLIDGRWAMCQWVERCKYLSNEVSPNAPKSLLLWSFREIPNVEL